MVWFPSVHLCVCLLTYSPLHIVFSFLDLILLIIAQIIFIIVRVNPIENEENPLNIIRKEPFQILVIFFSFT